jgi:hypothetical protein
MKWAFGRSVDVSKLLGVDSELRVMMVRGDIEWWG